MNQENPEYKGAQFESKRAPLPVQIIKLASVALVSISLIRLFHGGLSLHPREFIDLIFSLVLGSFLLTVTKEITNETPKKVSFVFIGGWFLGAAFALVSAFLPDFNGWSSIMINLASSAAMTFLWCWYFKKSKSVKDFYGANS